MIAREKTAKNALSPDSAWLFPEYGFESIDLENHQGVIIERILERGSWEQVRWLFSRYGEQRVSAWVRSHGFRLLTGRSFAFWRLVLGLPDFQAPDWIREAKEMVPW